MSLPDLDPLRQLLLEESTLALATVDPDGAPAIAPLFYLADAELLRLYWLSSPSSRHSRNLGVQSEAAVTVFHPTSDWRSIRGAQMTGPVEIVRGARRKELLALYAERFALRASFRLAIRRSSLYEFRPRRVRYLDNSVRFGYKTDFEL
jgi:uncharacterized protein YhbP (UPF0306 family)